MIKMGTHMCIKSKPTKMDQDDEYQSGKKTHSTQFSEFERFKNEMNYACQRKTWFYILFTKLILSFLFSFFFRFVTQTHEK